MTSPEYSHNTEGNYVALMETNGKECESWYYFIRYEGNEKNLKNLYDQLESVEWYILDDLSIFDLDLEHFISAKTAKEMTKLELNSYAFHRKFDGVLKEINLGFRKKDNNDKKICRSFDQLGYGQIEDYIDKEDLDPEDLTDNSGSDSEDSGSESGSENDSDSKEDSNKNSPINSSYRMPPVLGKKHR